MITDILYFLAGLALLIAGGNYVTDGAVSIARRWGVSPLLIGLVLVSIGSSLPDLVVCMISTISGKSTMAVGDVVGSNIFDVILVLGVMGVVKPYVVDRQVMSHSFTILFISSLILFFFGDDSLIDSGSINVITRSEGLTLLLLAVVFFIYSISNRKADHPDQQSVRVRNIKHLQTSDNEQQKPPTKVWLAWTMLVGGFVALAFGGDWLVKGASAIALKAGLSESFIGLTIVAFGGAAPDLASSLAALLKGKSSLAVGNIVGACVLNVFWVIGTCASIGPVHTGNIGTVDFLTLVGGCALVTLLAFTSRNHTISRSGGSILIAIYLAYTAYLLSQAGFLHM